MSWVTSTKPGSIVKRVSGAMECFYRLLTILAQVLTNFYCDKLDDADVVPPALQALTVLAKLPTFGDGDSTQVYKA